METVLLYEEVQFIKIVLLLSLFQSLSEGHYGPTLCRFNLFITGILLEMSFEWHLSGNGDSEDHFAVHNFICLHE